MRVIDIISYVDKTYHNELDQSIKIKMLQNLDEQIVHDLFETHENPPEYQIKDYAESTELLVPDKYIEIYIYYLQAKIHLICNEFVRYQNIAMLYDAAYAAYASDYNRSHKPIHAAGVLKFT